jgi:hypothetical protein
MRKSACGLKKIRTPWFDPMSEACELHDELYINNKLYGGEELRAQIDDRFYKKMLEIANSKSATIRPFLIVQAKLYYSIVRKFGSIAWEDKSNGV